ncbi:hypothetical protein CHARACLAT_018464 [Characodon lateralis]|uniref:Uncharacterized protein n=1 Tax=Characodon lateralis TaxID=208331 RepID=A0ABU7EUR8_9TELE|nr:hypothetical protein [Characodon lateralis]
MFWIIILKDPVPTHFQYLPDATSFFNVLEFQRIHDATDSTKVSSGRATGPQHHRSSTVLNSGHEELSLHLSADPPGGFVAEKLHLSQIRPELTGEMFSSQRT